MDKRDQLKAMLQDIINGKEEQAAVTMHDYFVAKTREVAGLSSSITDDLSELDTTEPDADEASPDTE